MIMNNVEISNMVKIHDVKNDLILVQNRRRSWCGIAFPGGHLENDESLYDAAVREVFEETGLTVSELKLCGIVHWCHIDDGKQTLIYYYSTESFTGELISDTEEGENFWISPSRLSEMKLSPGFDTQIKLFDNDYSELFIRYNGATGEISYIWR